MSSTLEISPEKLERLCYSPRFDQWIAAANDACLRHLSSAEEIHLEDGEWLCREGDEGAFFLILEGGIRIVKREGEQEMQFSVHKAGSFFGEIPLTMDSTFPVAGQAMGKTTVFKLGTDAFWGLFTSCPPIAKDVSKTLAKRLQRIESFSQTREKLVSLGTMAAGLAHELNNPAAAVQRSISQLRDSMRETEKHAMVLRAMEFDIQKSALLLELRDSIRPGNQIYATVLLSPMERADLEDELSDWLDDHGVPNACLLAPSFVHASLDLERLKMLATQVDPHEFVPVVSWLGTNLRTNDLTCDIERASTSITSLVQSVKSYSHLDEAKEETVDLHTGIESTLIMLKHKLRGIQIDCVFDRAIPLVCVRGSELNQVWTNFLDNAADALRAGDKARQGAHIGIKTGRDGRCAFVEISDNGPGIPKEIQSRVFEPFFTTKSVGSGTGLGLDIVHRIIVERHGGAIICHSDENGTCFRVQLPVEK
jgi:signal transduction histidine kinase